MFLPPAKPGISGKKIVIENTWVEIIRYISGKKTIRSTRCLRILLFFVMPQHYMVPLYIPYYKLIFIFKNATASTVINQLQPPV